MSRIIAFIKVTSNEESMLMQKQEIDAYVQMHSLDNPEFMEINLSSRKGAIQSRIKALLNVLNPDDTFIVSEISLLGRSTPEVIQLIDKLLRNDIRVIVINQSINIYQNDTESEVIVSVFRILAEMEKNLVMARTRKAIASKIAQGQKLGKPKGTIQKSKFDKDLDMIKQWLRDGVSIRRISKNLGYNNHIGLNNYIRSRNIKKTL